MSFISVVRLDQVGRTGLKNFVAYIMGYKMHGMTQELEESQEVRAVMVGCTGKTLAE